MLSISTNYINEYLNLLSILSYHRSPSHRNICARQKFSKHELRVYRNTTSTLNEMPKRPMERVQGRVQHEKIKDVISNLECVILNSFQNLFGVDCSGILNLANDNKLIEFVLT